MLNGIMSSSKSYFEHIAIHDEPTIRSIGVLFLEAGFGALLLFLVVLGVAFLAGILVNVAQFGLLISFRSLRPSLAKLNPISGFQQLFSKRIFINLAKQILKLSAVALIVWNTIASNLAFFAVVGQTAPSAILQMTSDLVFTIAWKFGFFLVLIGLADYIYERWQLTENLKMTKQEVKDEWRQSEGDPMAKNEQKKRRMMSRRRMMASIPRATVVVTNPTHYAVALEWDEVDMEAPVVTAKGADLVAKRIRDMAREYNVPIMENPPLARTLYERVEIDQAIPPHLYAAVAQVIAFVYKLKRKTIA